MKQLKLKALNLGVNELLSRESMKSVIGGLASGSTRGKCCPTKGGDAYGNGTLACSDCVTAPAGSHLDCGMGYLVSC